MTDLIVVEQQTEWRRLKGLVLDSVSSPITRRVYNMALDEFITWYALAPRPGFSKATVSAWRVSLEERKLGSSSIIVRMSAIRKLAVEASDNGLLAPEMAAGIQRVKSAKTKGVRMGNWLSLEQAQALLSTPDATYRERAPRSRDPGDATRVRITAVRSGGAHVRAHPAAGRALVHRRSRRQTQPRADGTDAGLGQSRD